MVLDLRQEIKLKQQLKMLPQLQQAIKLLVTPRQEIIQMIQRELAENPLLETDEEIQSTDQELENNIDVQIEKKESEEDGSDQMDWEAFIREYENLKPQDSTGYTSDPDTDPMKLLENRSADSEDIRSYLKWQIGFMELCETCNEIVDFLIDNVDNDGIIRIDDIIEVTAKKFEVTNDRVEGLLHLLQTLDPPGVCARSIKESFLIQLRQMGEKDSLLYKIIRDHFEELERTLAVEKIATELKVEKEAVIDAVNKISELNPHPGGIFDSEPTRYIEPDVFVYRDGDDFRIELNRENIPTLRINQFYQKILKGKNYDKEVKNYVKQKLKRAHDFINSITYWEDTLYQTAKAIVNFQKEFFLYGRSFLKPLRLKDVGNLIGKHESTISRIVTNKYMQTPHGIFEMRFFFGRGTNIGIDDVSTKVVMDKIKGLIDNENVNSPLTDGEIAEILKKQGIVIARRTVAKYREKLNIPSAQKRKRIKRFFDRNKKKED